MNKSSITVMGDGSRPATLKVLRNRARKKTITHSVTKGLMEIALKKGEEERYESYKNAFYCQSQIYTANGRMYGPYCKTRFCEICLGNRRNDKCTKYLPIIKSFPDPHFLTLTRLAVPKEPLDETIDEMVEIFESIKDKHKKRNQRGRGDKLIGVRSLESNFNGEEKTYNPHFHFIMPTFEMAETLKWEWIDYYGNDKICNIGGQDNKPITNVERELRHTIKYGTKFLSRRKRSRKTGELLPPFIYLAAIDNIFGAMKKHRLFDRFGFQLPETKVPKVAKYTSLTDYREWNYEAESHDWIAEDNGQKISGFVPEQGLTTILDTYQNMDFE
jgi:hypothetical protein